MHACKHLNVQKRRGGQMLTNLHCYVPMYMHVSNYVHTYVCFKHLAVEMYEQTMAH